MEREWIFASLVVEIFVTVAVGPLSGKLLPLSLRNSFLKDIMFYKKKKNLKLSKSVALISFNY